MSALTFDSLLATVRAFEEKYTIWYATSDVVPEGTVLTVAPRANGGWGIDRTYYVCHPATLDALKQHFPGLWRHIREWSPPTDIRKDVP